MKKQYEKEIKEKLEKVISEELDKTHNIKNTDERLIKQDYLFNVFKILKNYTELEPTLKRFFAEKHKKDKQKALESWDSIEK